MKTKNKRDSAAANSSAEAAGEFLSVVIVGGSEAVGQSSEIIDSLLAMGYAVKLLGVIDETALDWTHANDAGSFKPGLALYQHAIMRDPPDLVIVTSDNHDIRKIIVEIIPPQTRVLDPFAIKIFQALKKVSGELDTVRNRLETVELMKEVLMAGSEVSIMVVNENLRILDINNAFLERAKLPREVALGRRCRAVVEHILRPCSGQDNLCLAEEVLRTGRPVHTVKETTGPDNAPQYFTISAYPLKEGNNGKKSVLIVLKDVTRGLSDVLDRQVRSIRENLTHFVHQDKMIALGKLAAAAVHEINNPIQGILTFAKLMRSTLDKESLSEEDIQRFRTYLDLVATESARCGQILRGLLSFSRQESLKKGSVPIGPLLDEIGLLLGNRMDLQGIRLDTAIRKDLPGIHGDRDQIKQGLLNLILNAIEAMPDGGVVNVCADLHPDGKHVIIRVRDTGPGVPAEIQGNVFEPFFSTKQNGKGVGLGLSVVHGIIAQHGGTIEIDSPQGDGAAFILTLPAYLEGHETKVTESQQSTVC